MAYKALYNKYRPSTFEEVAGQRSIVKTLANAISSGKIGHAYLFCGPRGTGKTSMARLFAKALNCNEGLGKQCNVCQNCTSINEGAHPDVIEIDAASNNGVDQVRELIEQVKYAPMIGRYKIYIIDEVHMMSQGAFNALLKTLEEPPEYVIFILATTEPHKVLATIISRCQRFDFEKIDDSDIKNKIIWVLQKEGIQYEDKALDVITDLSDGGMRDALSILEQVLAYSGNSITEKDVLTLFGLTSNLQKIELLKLLRQGVVANALIKLEEFVSAGADIKRLSSSLLDMLKDLVIYERTHEVTLLTTLDEKDAQSLESVIDFVYANKMIDILLKSQSDYKSVSNIRALFELTMLQLCALAEETNKPAQPEAPKVTQTIIENPQPVPTPVQVAKPTPAPVVEEKKLEEPPSFLFAEDKPIENPQPVPTPAPEPKVEQPVEEKSLVDASKISSTVVSTEGDMYTLDKETLIQIFVLGNKEEKYKLNLKWAEFEKLKAHPTLGTLATLLSDGKPFCLANDVLLISYNFRRLRDKANIKSNQKALSEMVESILGRKVFIYALDRIDVHDYTQYFVSLTQINKLPKKEDIVLNLPKEGE